MLIRKHDEVCKGYPNGGQKLNLMYGGLRKLKKAFPDVWKQAQKNHPVGRHVTHPNIG